MARVGLTLRTVVTPSANGLIQITVPGGSASEVRQQGEARSTVPQRAPDGFRSRGGAAPVRKLPFNPRPIQEYRQDRHILHAPATTGLYPRDPVDDFHAFNDTTKDGVAKASRITI